jgi:DNA-binding transcriptional LysR family regulator
MNLRQLRTFIAIADAGGVARAAARLHLSQPATSRQIAALEADLGVPLFDRIGRRVQLTSEGEDLLRRSRHLLAEADLLSERARALKGGQSGILRVGATPQVIETMLANFLPHYRRSHPGVEVLLVEDGGVRLPGRLERGEVNLAFIPAGDARFDGRLLYPMHVLIVVAKNHRLSRRSVVEIEDLADEPLLVLRRGFGSRAWFDAACEIAHVRPRVVLESAAPHTVMALAASGYGTAVVPSNVEFPHGRGRAVPLVYHGASIGKWNAVGWDPQRFQSPYAEQFVKEIAAFVRRTFPGRDLIRRAPPLARPKGR